MALHSPGPVVDFLHIFLITKIGNRNFEYINLNLLAPYIYETEM